MSFDLSKPAQQAFDHDGRIMVLGGPGSGKTTLSLLKTQRLIPTLEPGQNVLFLSFSRAAVRQVLNRTKDVLTREERSRITVQTYHAFCMDILRAHGRLLTGSPARILFPDREKVTKANYEGDWNKERDRLATAEGLYAFDNFAGGAGTLLTKVPKVAELVADRFPIIILDEFQDTSDAQWQLVQALSERSELVILADPDQRIFEYDDRVDPERLNQVRELLAPVEFDLGAENHRSPDAGILQFADAVLRHRELPETDDVKVFNVWPRQLDTTTHVAAIWLYSQLRKAGIVKPSVVVLARTNAMVSEVSGWFSQAHQFKRKEYGPLTHDVLWDAEISAAAAQVIASVLEWPEPDSTTNAASTLDAIAAFFEVKSAAANNGPIVSAITLRDRYRMNAQALRDGRNVRPKGAKHIVASAEAGLVLVGDPRADWIAARKIIEGADGLDEIAQAVRFVRLFGATDEIGGRLSEEWDRTGSYGRATDIVRRTLDQGRLATEQREPQGFVLMNMHKSKGKEFDGVVIVEGHHRSMFFTDREEAPHLATRRLLRVAITRARHKVVIVRPMGAAPFTG
ncbi:ATP-dependent helicase [Microbacterium sp. LRZ72]|uniref:ATP-dependent helicase n=1 Tax=Microbacterium sp. LRZ72 TaxID=2942481 RepID=UPI0029B498CA|nr:ATP-dependent helicase [Microbacterium sp. LRZ72]MDX2375623.1 ATP-dependent helicase [Microbacterium sp. LRZ72]